MTADRFGTGTGRYDAARPSYPAPFLKHIAAATPEGSELILDVGAGTGLLTRQLASAFPGARVVGLEPSAAMLAEARSIGGGPAYVAGSAEALPFEAGAARALTAGAAAHWFDRRAFYAEAGRVLSRRGVLAILDYPRDEAGFPATAAAETFLRRFGPKAYVRPDYAAELDQHPQFALQEASIEAVEQRLAPTAYVELILSSSHARAAEAALGAAQARREVEALATSLVEADGLVAYGYRFRMSLAVRS